MAINLKTATVTFNKEVDAATLNAGIKVYTGTSTTARVVDTTPADVTGQEVGYILSEDKKSATIVFGSAIAQSTNVKFVIDGVKDLAGVKAAKYEESITVTDTTFPTLERVTVLNSKTVEVAVSEPLNPLTQANAFASRAEIKVNGVSVPVKVTTDVAGNKLVLEFGSKLPTGAHKLQLADFTDFANFKVVAKEFDFTVAADTVAPEVVAAEAVDKDTAKITFSEPVDVAGTIKVNTKTANPGDLTWSADKKVVTFKQLDIFDLGSTVESTVKYKGTKDVEGNTVTDEKTFTFQATDDIVKPTISSVEVKTGNAVEVTFSKTLSANGTVTVKNDKGNVVVNKLAVTNLNADKKTTFSAAQLALSANGGTYTLEFEGAKDNSVRKNEMEKYTTTISAKDIQKPTAALVFKEAGKLTVQFDEAMNATDLANKDNYIIDLLGLGADDKYLSAITDSSIVVAPDAKSVELTIPTATAATKVSLQGVKDLAGNIVSNFNSKLVATDLAIVTFDQTDIASVKAVGVNKVEVKLTSKTFTSVDPSSFVLYDGQVAGSLEKLVATQATLNAAKDTVTLTLNANLDSNAKLSGAALYLGVPTANKLTKDEIGKELSIAAASRVVVADEIKPEIKEVKKGTAVNTFDITFTEAMTVTTALAALKNDIVIIPDGSTTGVPLDSTGEFNITTADEIVYTVSVDPTAFGVTSTGSKGLSFTIPNPTANLVDANGIRLAPVTVAKTVTLDVKSQATLDKEAADLDITAAKAALATPTVDLSGSDLGTLAPTGLNTTVIAWESSDSTKLDDAGVWVSGIAGGETVTLTATISKGTGTPQTKTFTVTVDNTKITAITTP